MAEGAVREAQLGGGQGVEVTRGAEAGGMTRERRSICLYTAAISITQRFAYRYTYRVYDII